MSTPSRPASKSPGADILPQSLSRIIARASVEDDEFLGEARVRFKVHLDASQLTHKVTCTEDLEPYFKSLWSYLERAGHVCVSGGSSVWDYDEQGNELGPCISVEIRGTIAQLKGLAEQMTPKQGRGK